MQAVEPDPELKRFYRHKLVQKGLGKARVAAARKLTGPSRFIANARYLSSFNSYCQVSPSGNFFTARHGIGSMKCASLIFRVYKVG